MYNIGVGVKEQAYRMVIRTKLLQDSCKKILDAVDSSNIINKVVSETVEIKVSGRELRLNVTNREYYVSVSLPLDVDAELHAVVEAKLFLTLISKISTNDVELTTTNTTLIIKGNGNYKVPLIYDEAGKLVELPRIEVENVTSEFGIKGSVLQSILKYNAKELLKGTLNRPSQRLFYIDEKGALTFTSGACVNSFELESPVTLFLTEKVVKLFRLFKGDVRSSLGHADRNGRAITLVSFEDGSVSLTSAIGIDQSVTSTFPVSAIRGLADASYEHTVNLCKADVLDAITRLSLFSTQPGNPGVFIEFGAEGITIYDERKDNNESVAYSGDAAYSGEPYLASFVANDLRLTLESCDETHVNVSFGNHRNILVSRGSVKNVVPECRQ